MSGIFNRDLNTNQNIFDLPFESLDANIEKVKKRNFQEFFEENIVQKTVIIDEAYKKDKEEIERITKNSDIVNNPLILAETYKNFVMDRERYSHDEKDVFPFSHWIYKEKDERLIIEEIFQMFSSQETEIFALKKDEKYEYSIYYIKVKCQVSHLSPLALENILVEFVQMANSLQELEFLITDLQSISKGNIFDGFLNSIMKIKIGFYENLSNLQLLFHFQSYKSLFAFIYKF